MTKVKDFLENIRAERKERLYALIVDIGFFKNYLSDYDEDSLREELSEENKKIKKNKKEEIIKDNRDMDKVKRLSAIIDKITSTKQKLNQFETLVTDLRDYNYFINDLPANVLEDLVEQESKL